MLWVILRLTFPLFSLLSVLIMLGAGFGAVFQSDVPQIAYESDPEGNWDIFLLGGKTHDQMLASWPFYRFCTKSNVKV